MSGPLGSFVWNPQVIAPGRRLLFTIHNSLHLADGFPPEERNALRLADGFPPEERNALRLTDGFPSEGLNALCLADGFPSEGLNASRLADGFPSEGLNASRLADGFPSEGRNASRLADHVWSEERQADFKSPAFVPAQPDGWLAFATSPRARTSKRISAPHLALAREQRKQGPQPLEIAGFS